jgi:hypothetical protein
MTEDAPAPAQFSVNAPDNEIAARRRALRHVERDPAFRGSPHDAKGVQLDRPSPGTEAAAKLELSAQAAAARAGKVRPDSADALTAMLTYHRADAAAKRHALSGWFEQWSASELSALETLVTAADDDERVPVAERELGPEHPFVRWRVRWTNIYRTHHEVFLQELDAVRASRLGGAEFERDDMWAAVVLEFALRSQPQEA